MKPAKPLKSGKGDSKLQAKKPVQKGNAEVKKPRGLTTKQKKLVQGIIEGKTQREAAKEAGLHETYASNILKEPKVQATLQELMEHMGLSDGALLIKHRELLNAQKQISGIKDADGGSVEFIEVPDYPTQMKALETAYKLKGAFVEKREITGANGSPLSLDLTVNFVSPR